MKAPIFPSPKYRLFLWISAFLALADLLILNDWITLKPSWEGQFLKPILEHQSWSSLSLPQLLTSLFYDSVEGNLFMIRLPGILVLGFGLLLAYRWGKAVFGKEFLLNSGLVLLSSFALLFCGKFLVGDIWLLIAQLLAAFSMLRFLKQASVQWAACFWGAVFFGILIHPWSLVISMTTFGTYLRFIHPQGKSLDRLLYWCLALLLFLTSYQSPGFIFAYGNDVYWKYLAIAFLGFLPWAGFLVASFADTWYKMRKGEEMGIILVGMLLAGLSSQSLLLVVALAMMIGRQLSAYFNPNYPYRSLTRGAAVVHLLTSFALITYLLIYAFSEQGATGFRGVMAPGAVYWMLTLTGVIGLFGNQRPLIIGGMAWGALLAMFLFWVQLYPVFFT